MIFTGSRLPLVAGSISAACSVAAGAFGAHVLSDALEPQILDVFETAARYQMYHALGMIAAGLAGSSVADKRRALFASAGKWFLAGTLLFSGSLYALVLTEMKWLGAVTPFGGVSYIAGWLLFAYAVIRRNTHAGGGS
jgi:uncharacterized membrane protein YgdD (TMEM256/DUF423 family)